jgi:hypothetical protein
VAWVEEKDEDDEDEDENGKNGPAVDETDPFTDDVG